MKEIIEKILAYLPVYLVDFGSIFAGPKRFIAQKNARAEETFEEALIFLGISMALVVIMTVPLLPPGKDIWSHLGTIAVTSLLTVTLSAGALRIAWRLVGGKATVRSFFVTYAYYFGVLIVILIFFHLLSEGIFKVFAPDLHALVLEAKLNKQPIPDISGSSVPIISFFVLVAGFLFTSVWGFIGWGAYRALNGLNKWQSFSAMMIMGVFGWIIAAVVYFIGVAMGGN